MNDVGVAGTRTMLMSHANSKHTPTDDVKYSLLVEGGVAEQTCTASMYQKLTRFKLWSILLGLVLGIVFLTYKITVSYHPSPVTQSNPLTYTHIQAVEPREQFSDRIRYKHTKRRLPQCLIIGIRKAGTRALLTYLNLHPQIQTASEEVHFFDDEHNYERGLEWYRKKMPYSFPEEITVEKTPGYFSVRSVPARMHHMNSSVKLLLIVRNPFDRTVSDYLQITLKKQAKGLQTYPFERMIMKKNGLINMEYPPLVRSVYHMYMENWLQSFNLSQFHIIDGDKLISDPFGEINKVEDFLGLSHRITSDNFYYNESRGFFCIRNETRDKCLADSKGRAHPTVDPYVRDKLKEFFRPYNEKFFQLAQRRFDWD